MQSSFYLLPQSSAQNPLHKKILIQLSDSSRPLSLGKFATSSFIPLVFYHYNELSRCIINADIRIASPIRMALFLQRLSRRTCVCGCAISAILLSNHMTNTFLYIICQTHTQCNEPLTRDS